MPSNKFEWLNRVKAVEREHTAMRHAADFLLSAVYNDSTILDRFLRVRDIADAAKQLEGTYLIRLFAEFETSLRVFWQISRRTDPPARTRDLLDGVGAKQRVPHDMIQSAHAVREFRNTLVHERNEEMAPLSIADARRSLCLFLNFLPLEW